MRSIPSTLRLWALSLAASSLCGQAAMAQVQVLPGQGSSEVHKCVRAGEIFYTNGACPSGPAEVNMGPRGPGGTPRVRTVPATPPVTATPVPVVPAPIAPTAPVSPVAPVAPPVPVTRTAPVPASPVTQPGMITITPSPSAQRRPANRPTQQVESTPVEPWTTVQPGSLQRRQASPVRIEPEETGARPLSAFPPLPESDAGRRAERMERSDRAERSGTVVQVEEPMRGAGRNVEAAPAPDARANNQAMCGFVGAELTRLAEEASAATSDDVRSRIAAQQQRLKARHAQLKC